MSRKENGHAGKPGQQVPAENVAAGSGFPIFTWRANQDIDEPLPRAARQPRRAKKDRGLPPDEELVKLAMLYLEFQRRHWPEFAEAGLLPEPSESVLQEMVQEFKDRHRSGETSPSLVQPLVDRSLVLGGAYCRYSCDNSSPTSIADQMVNCLAKARQEDRFIPWQYVFCDYSLSGLYASRQGYSSYKAVVVDSRHLIETTYVDDFTRASRDELEWWKLAALSKRLRKRMIGASDGFDLSHPHSDILITVYLLVSRLFIKGLREKARRGMRGAARRGTCLGKPSLGFTRRVHRDAKGHAVTDPDGRPIYEVCIDPVTSKDRQLLYELFLVKNWSIGRIARHFNTLGVDGSNGWSWASIAKLIANPSVIGVLIWNQVRREFDPETGKWIKSENPASEWEVYVNRALQLVPVREWQAARRKLAGIRRKSSQTGRKPSRNNISATTLFSGTLFCHDCASNDGTTDGAELKLIRSTARYKQLGCMRGTHGTHKCGLTTSKSTRIVEECLLSYLRDVVLTETALEGLVQKANHFLHAEAERPSTDIAPLMAKRRTLEE